MIYLASQSPRRRELLQQIGVDYQVIHVAVDETHLPGEPAEVYVKRIAQSKAAAGRQLCPDHPFIHRGWGVVRRGEGGFRTSNSG